MTGQPPPQLTSCKLYAPLVRNTNVSTHIHTRHTQHTQTRIQHTQHTDSRTTHTDSHTKHTRNTHTDATHATHTLRTHHLRLVPRRVQQSLLINGGTVGHLCGTGRWDHITTTTATATATATHVNAGATTAANRLQCGAHVLNQGHQVPLQCTTLPDNSRGNGWSDDDVHIGDNTRRVVRQGPTRRRRRRGRRQRAAAPRRRLRRHSCLRGYYYLRR